MRWMKFAGISGLVVVLGVALAVKFGSFEIARLQAKVDELERERERLTEFATRLSASRRVAQVDVLRQESDAQGRPTLTLLWQEIGVDGLRGQPIETTVNGTQVYFEALVLKFEHRLVGEGDEHRPPAVSLALFRRIFGDREAPESVPELGRRSLPPGMRGETPGVEQSVMWARFWEMVDDPRVAARYGVRVAQCEAPSVRMKPGEIWEVTVDAAGGVNLKRPAVN